MDESDNWESKDNDKYEMMDMKKEEVEYLPPSLLDIPDHIKNRMRENGYYLKWKRFRVGGANGGYDTKNIRRALSRNEGYSFATPSDFLPEELIEVGEIEAYSGNDVITNGDVVLMKVPIERAEARRRYFETKTKNQSDAIKQRLAEANIESKSRSTVRTGKNAHFSTNT